MTIYEDRARRRRNIAILVAAGVLFVLAWQGCSFTGGPVSGRVIDIDTGNPIANAIVVVRWRGEPIMWAPTVCFHVDTAVSDHEGQYYVPMWWQTPRTGLLGNGWVADAYRAGYERVHSHTKEAETHPEDVYMRKFVGNNSERFEYIGGPVFNGMSCLGARASRRNLFLLHKAAILEAKGLAQSEQQKRSIEGMRIIAADDWLAATPTYRETFLRPLENLPADVRKELE